MRQNDGDAGDSGRVPALSLDSPWAWFYYSTFGVQAVVVTAYALRYRTAISYNSALDIYIATLLEVSIRIPAMAVYSLFIAVTVEVIRMIAERYLAKRFRQGKAVGIAEVLEILDEDTRKEVERKLRRNGNSSHLPEDK